MRFFLNKKSHNSRTSLFFFQNVFYDFDSRTQELKKVLRFGSLGFEILNGNFKKMKID